MDIVINLFNLFTDFLNTFYGMFFIIPLCFLGIELITQLRKLLLQMLQTLLT